ncbi:unnamed protein product [Schistocephalus solidus]|uniref:SNF2_N domain-containing protein n=1 Tax=Schistocephalus solidus TaxID=70667 RepID=A0A183T7J3_SCHSO|nr:unnamed protein product [Schistocephalus solidus]
MTESRIPEAVEDAGGWRGQSRSQDDRRWEMEQMACVAGTAPENAATLYACSNQPMPCASGKLKIEKYTSEDLLCNVEQQDASVGIPEFPVSHPLVEKDDGRVFEILRNLTLAPHLWKSVLISTVLEDFRWDCVGSRCFPAENLLHFPDGFSLADTPGILHLPQTLLYKAAASQEGCFGRVSPKVNVGFVKSGFLREALLMLMACASRDVEGGGLDDDPQLTPSCLHGSVIIWSMQVLQFLAQSPDGVQVLVEYVLRFTRGLNWKSVGADEGVELVSKKRQVEAHQVIIGALRQTEQTSHDVVKNGKIRTVSRSSAFGQPLQKKV